MVDIQVATAEIRQGKKERKNKVQDENITSASAMQGGHNKVTVLLTFFAGFDVTCRVAELCHL